MNFAILDDERHCVESMAIHLNNLYPDARIVYKGSNTEEALTALSNIDVDILFLDVEMPVMNGFQFLEQFRDRKFDVIFTTAYSQYAIEAFKNRAVNYLLKPIDEDELNEAIEIWRKSRVQDGNEEKMRELLESFKTDGFQTKIAVPVSDGYEFIEAATIVYCQSKSNYTTIYFEDSKKMLVSKTLKDIENMLKSFSFIRVHQSYLINPKFLNKYVRRDGGYLILQDNIKIPVSSQKKKNITDLFDNHES